MFPLWLILARLYLKLYLDTIDFMNLLEILYAQEFKTTTFYPRKQSITHPKTLLIGPKKSGKTTLVLDHLSQAQKGSFLYIDFADLRVNQAIFFGLPNFLTKNNIRLLVLDNFDFSFKIPDCENVIVTTHQAKSIAGFATQKIYPLDFEEFIAFEKRQMNIEAIFNDYADAGTYPVMAQSSKEHRIKNFQNLITLMCETPLEFTIFQKYALSQGLIVSSFSLFNEIKLFHKVSKDKFYANVKKLQEENMIFLVEKYQVPRADKKVYLIDFAIKSVLTFDKDFIKRFENIIYLELFKGGERVYYTDLIDFYIPDTSKAVIALPFLPLPMIKTKLERIEKELEKYQIKKIEIITLESEGAFTYKHMDVEILPFWSWALQR